MHKVDGYSERALQYPLFVYKHLYVFFLIEYIYMDLMFSMRSGQAS